MVVVGVLVDDDSLYEALSRCGMHTHSYAGCSRACLIAPAQCAEPTAVSKGALKMQDHVEKWRIFEVRYTKSNNFRVRWVLIALWALDGMFSDTIKILFFHF